MYKNITQLSKLDYVLKNLLYLLFFIFTFFPFITVIDLGTDMQPYGLFMALILFFFFKNITLDKAHLFLLLVFFSSIFVFLVSGINFGSSRSLFNYIQLFLVSYVAYQILKTERINFEFF